jgi:alkyl hydroperoxide reductase 1
MSGLKAGDQFPEDVVFSQAPPGSTLIGRCLQLRLIRYVPYTEEKGDITACGIPQNYNASKEWVDKKVILFAVPGQYITTFSGGHF